MKDILDYWPYPFPLRQNQVTALNWLSNQDKKYLICDIPVGSGKSNIGITFSRYLADKDAGDSFILTPQRILQQQYIDSNKGITEANVFPLFGKGNYQCQAKGTTCDVGSLIKPKCGNCTHKRAKTQAVNSPNVVLNYKVALLNFMHTDTFAKRKLMILDECHTTERHLIDLETIIISQNRCMVLGIAYRPIDDLLELQSWLHTIYIPHAKRKLDEWEDEVTLIEKKRKHSKNDLNKLKRFKGLSEHVDEVVPFTSMDPNKLQHEFVVTSDSNSIQLKPLYARDIFKSKLDLMADRFLFMSSTVLNKEGFCRDLGINPDDAAYLSLGSEFKAQNRPVYYMPQLKMNYKWNHDENKGKRQKFLDRLLKICEAHESDSGIIHTGNFVIAKWLTEELEKKGSHRIFHHNPPDGQDRNDVIKSFQLYKKPAILISPSITEGLDLTDDLARFAIIAKIPYGFLGDKWIKKRMELSGEWYQRQALIDVIQGCGRVVRSADDWGNTYVLDESFGFLLNQTRNSIPDWWAQSLVVPKK